jgi:heat shock protein HslJ
VTRRSIDSVAGSFATTTTGEEETMMKRNNLIVLLAAWLMAACDSTTSMSDLSDVEGSWELQSFDLNDGSVLEVPDGQTFTLNFDADGNVHAQVDCNVCNGSFQTDGDSISLGLLACTLVACSPASLDHQFQTALSSATSFVRTGSELSIRYAGGTMRFRLG